MRGDIRGVLLGAMFGLATTSGVGQTAAGIHLVDVRFRGDTQWRELPKKYPPYQTCHTGVFSNGYAADN
jgi:hypothetical protein